MTLLVTLDVALILAEQVGKSQPSQAVVLSLIAAEDAGFWFRGPIKNGLDLQQGVANSFILECRSG